MICALFVVDSRRWERRRSTNDTAPAPATAPRPMCNGALVSNSTASESSKYPRRYRSPYKDSDVRCSVYHGTFMACFNFLFSIKTAPPPQTRRLHNLPGICPYCPYFDFASTRNLFVCSSSLEYAWPLLDRKLHLVRQSSLPWSRAFLCRIWTSCDGQTRTIN